MVVVFTFICVFFYFKVKPEMQMIFPDNVNTHTQQHGICYVKTFPMFTTDNITVYTDDGCAITKYPVSINSTYTTAIFFTLDDIDSSCQYVTCLTQFKREVKNINICKQVLMCNSIINF